MSPKAFSSRRWKVGIRFIAVTGIVALFFSHWKAFVESLSISFLLAESFSVGGMLSRLFIYYFIFSHWNFGPSISFFSSCYVQE